MVMVGNILGAFLVSLVVSFLVMPLIIGLLRRKNLMDTPDRRKIHRNVIPSMGGIGIIAGMGVSLLIWLTFKGIVEFKYLLAGVGLLFVVGIRDDLLPVSPRVKIIVQILAASIVVVSGVMINSGFGLFGVQDLNITIRVFLSIGFIIFFTNSFNLIDGLDGLAGTIALIIATFFTSWFYLNEAYYLAVIGAAVIGAVLGFIYYNWQPARIFMGDTGALSLGFLFAVLGILFLNQAANPQHEIYKINAPVAMLIAVLFVPIFDTSRIIVVRLVKRRSPFEPDNNHTHHVLMRLGLTHRQVALALAGMNLLAIGLVLIFRKQPDNVLLPILVIAGFLISVTLDQLIIQRVRSRGGRARQRLQAEIEAKNSGNRPVD
jgi:UDP-N-acetylmuramyl pentapeptide phosphotransferase/UDP-N-acetylglucosamine-1-phosphate transferase